MQPGVIFVLTIIGIALAFIVVAYFDAFGSSYFEPVANRPADWRLFSATLTTEILLGLAWLVITGSIAVRRMMYARA